MKSLENKVSDLDAKLNKRCDDLEADILRKINISEFTPVEEQVESLRSDQDDLYAQVQKQADELSRLIAQSEKQQLEASKLELQNEAYSKRFNVLIHGIPEDPKNPWESRDSTVKLFHKFLIDGLKVEDFNELPLVDIHRLPQRPIYSDKGRVNRPIIIKLYNSDDKHWLFSRLKFLKSYNDTRYAENREAKPVFVTEHLPKSYYEQKKALMPLFKKARNENKKTSWAVINGDYSLLVDGVRVK